MNIEELRAEFQQRSEELTKAQVAYRKAEDELAIAVCPYKIGDVLVDRLGRQARVTKITGGNGYSYEYKLFGVNVKKDGSDGAAHELAWWNDWKKD